MVRWDARKRKREGLTRAEIAEATIKEVNSETMRKTGLKESEIKRFIEEWYTHSEMRLGRWEGNHFQPVSLYNLERSLF